VTKQPALKAHSLSTGTKVFSHPLSFLDSLVMSSSYVLPEADLDDNGPLPVMRAARNPNSAVLLAITTGLFLIIKILARMRPDGRSASLGLSCDPTWDSDLLYLAYDSPLLEAVKAELLENVAVLLRAGADPNGLTIDMFSRYSAQFIRFHRSAGHVTRTEAFRAVPEAQTSPLTSSEIESRSKSWARFWAEEDFLQPSKIPKPAPTALEAAARTRNVAIFDKILAANPDTSWWMDGSQTTQSKFPMPSFLSISTPLHGAVEAGHHHMIKHILERGFRPNTLPLAAVTRALLTDVSDCLLYTS